MRKKLLIFILLSSFITGCSATQNLKSTDNTQSKISNTSKINNTNTIVKEEDKAIKEYNEKKEKAKLITTKNKDEDSGGIIYKVNLYMNKLDNYSYTKTYTSISSSGKKIEKTINKTIYPKLNKAYAKVIDKDGKETEEFILNNRKIVKTNNDYKQEVFINSYTVPFTFVVRSFKQDMDVEFYSDETRILKYTGISQDNLFEFLQIPLYDSDRNNSKFDLAIHTDKDGKILSYTCTGKDDNGNGYEEKQIFTSYNSADFFPEDSKIQSLVKEEFTIQPTENMIKDFVYYSFYNFILSDKYKKSDIITDFSPDNPKGYTSPIVKRFTEIYVDKYNFEKDILKYGKWQDDKYVEYYEDGYQYVNKNGIWMKQGISPPFRLNIYGEYYQLYKNPNTINPENFMMRANLDGSLELFTKQRITRSEELQLGREYVDLKSGSAASTIQLSFSVDQNFRKLRDFRSDNRNGVDKKKESFYFYDDESTHIERPRDLP